MHETLWFFLKGALVGASIAAPVGPVAILCIRQTLTHGWLVGVMAGMGTAIADGCFGAVAAFFGTTLINTLLKEHEKWFYALGGIALTYIGYKIFSTKINRVKDNKSMQKTHWSAFISTLLLTFASPMTALLFVGMFSTLGIFDQPLIHENILPLSLGVSAGALVWWIGLTGLIAFVSKKIDHRVFSLLNRVSGIAIFAFGIMTIAKALP